VLLVKTCSVMCGHSLELSCSEYSELEGSGEEVDDSGFVWSRSELWGVGFRGTSLRKMAFWKAYAEVSARKPMTKWI
jgi:hypothetical protein